MDETSFASSEDDSKHSTVYTTSFAASEGQPPDTNQPMLLDGGTSFASRDDQGMNPDIVAAEPLNQQAGNVLGAGHFSSETKFAKVEQSLDAFNKTVYMGTSFGVQGREESATIGGEIVLRDSKGLNERYFMTNFHPFRDIVTERFKIEGNHRSPYKIPVVIPSTADTNHTLESASDPTGKIALHSQDQVAGLFWTCGKFKHPILPDMQSKDKKIRHYQRPLDGVSPDNTTLLDWALIKPNEGWLIVNSLSDASKEDAERKSTRRYGAVPQFQPDVDDVQVWSTENISGGRLVLKKGRTTSVTVGKLISTDGLVPVGEHGTKYDAWRVESTDPLKPFMSPGDSGSWARDMQGNWIGLLFAEIGSGDGLMLPVDALLEDIERTTSMTVVKPWKDGAAEPVETQRPVKPVQEVKYKVEKKAQKLRGAAKDAYRERRHLSPYIRKGE